MATASSPMPQSNPNGHRIEIEGCLIDVINDRNPSPNPRSTLPPLLELLPVVLRIFFDPLHNLAFFRMRASVSLVGCPTRTSVFLDISPEKVVSLEYDSTARPAWRAHPPAARPRLHFTLRGPGALVAPSALTKLLPETDADRQMLETIRLLSQRLAIAVHLPPDATLPQSSDLCKAASTAGRLRADAAQTSLRSLYYGVGGRVVPPDEAFGHPPPPHAPASTPPGSTGGGDIRGTPAEAENPPMYAEITSPPPPPPLSAPEHAAPSRKRKRTGSSDPDIGSRVAVDDDEVKILKSELQHLRCELHDMKSGLQDLVAREIKAQLGDTSAAGRGPARPGKNMSASSTPTASPSVSGESHGASDVSSRSERLAAYVEERVEALRGELEAQSELLLEQRLEEYVVFGEMENFVRDEVADKTVNFMDEDEMWENIRDVVDEHMTNLRERMMNALQD